MYVFNYYFIYWISPIIKKFCILPFLYLEKHVFICNKLIFVLTGGGDLPDSKYLREHYVSLIKKDYDENLKEFLEDKKLIVLCDETTNTKGEAAFLVLFKILPTLDNVDPFLVVAGVKILTAVNGDETSKAILQVIFSLIFL